MSDRDKYFRRLAEVMGWEWCAALQRYECLPEGVMIYFIDTPDPDASLHRHLQFVGRIAEEIQTGPGETDWLLAISRLFDGWDYGGWRVVFRSKDGGFRSAEATDLSWAAVRAALAAKGVQ